MRDPTPSALHLDLFGVLPSRVFCDERLVTPLFYLIGKLPGIALTRICRCNPQRLCFFLFPLEASFILNRQPPYAHLSPEHD